MPTTISNSSGWTLYEGVLLQTQLVKLLTKVNVNDELESPIAIRCHCRYDLGGPGYWHSSQDISNCTNASIRDLPLNEAKCIFAEKDRYSRGFMQLLLVKD